MVLFYREVGNMKKFIVILLIALLCTSFIFAVEEKEKGPFGTKWLSTKEELEEAGTLSLAKDYGDYSIYYFDPIKGHSAFDSYLVIILDDVGFVKIGAYGKDISCNEYGTALKSAFSDMKNSLVKSYGTPTDDYDFNSSSYWKDADDWMYSLYMEYRVLACVWETDSLGIILKANAPSTSKGNIELSYEHKKWGEYLNKKSAVEENNL